MPAKVSICIPVFNRRPIFRATLWSVLRQTYPHMEVIVSDNASQDDIGAEIAEAADPRVRYVRQQRNIGGAANFVFLQGLAEGEYLLFLGSDDLLLPRCIERAVGALEAAPARGGVVFRAGHYTAEGFQFVSTLPDLSYAGADEYETHRSVRKFIPSPSLCLYRASAFRRLGGWDSELRAIIDWELYSRMVRLGGGVIFLPEVLAIIRLHDDRMSTGSALHWDFYYDAMKLAARAEHGWGGAYRAKAFMEQLLWDLRLRQSPRRTIGHAWETHAIRDVTLFLPWEILRRFGVKLTALARRLASSRPATATSALPREEREALDQVWQTGESVRKARSLTEEEA